MPEDVMQGHPQKELIALGVQQPWAELIVRGIKTIEVRSQPTKVRGTIYVYASKKFSAYEAADEAVGQFDLDPDAMPRGVIVGTVEIIGSRATTEADSEAACVPTELLATNQAWELDNAIQFDIPLVVEYLPYGVWFYPFMRKK